MASTTTNIGLTKPAGTDQALISAINGNMDIIDTKMGAVGNTSVQSQITSLSDQISTIVRYDYSNDSGKNISVTRIGKICMINCVSGNWYSDSDGSHIRLGSASGDQWIVPTGAKPYVQCEIMEALNGKRITIDVNGAVTCNEKLTGIPLRFTGMWFTE